MMLKVRFLEKNVKRFNNGKITTVQLRGGINWPYGADNHLFWLWMKNYIKHNQNITTDGYTVIVKGKAACSDEDTIDNVLGERIAEARAKITLYKFMKNLCKQVYTYYKNLLCGQSVIKIEIDKENKDSLCNSHLKYCALVGKEEQHLNDLLNGRISTKSSSQS
jgi:hypothetical protein